jgi:hypothetical protein
MTESLSPLQLATPARNFGGADPVCRLRDSACLPSKPAWSRPDHQSKRQGTAGGPVSSGSDGDQSGALQSGRCITAPRAADLGATYGSDHVRQDAGRRLPGLVGPSIDSRTTSIPVDLVVGPYDGPDGVGSPFATADTAVWLFLPKQRELARMTLELAMRAGGKRLRRYRFNVTLES